MEVTGEMLVVKHGQPRLQGSKTLYTHMVEARDCKYTTENGQILEFSVAYFSVEAPSIEEAIEAVKNGNGKLIEGRADVIEKQP